MKNLNVIFTSIYFPAVLFLLFTNGCNINENSVYRQIRDHAGRIKVINTHEHQRWVEEYPAQQFSLYHLLAVSYLAADINCAGGKGLDIGRLDSLTLEDLWNTYGEALDYTRNTSYYGQFVKGMQKLYDFNDLFFTRDNISALSERIRNNYKNYKQWFDESFHKAGYEIMFLDQYWNPYNTEPDNKYFALVFHINPLVAESSHKPENGTELKGVYKIASGEGYTINNLDDYLSFCDHLFKKNIANKAVCLKNSQAYSRTLFYEDVPYEEARILYAKPSSQLTPAEAKKIEDFMFHRIIQKSIEYELPVQIHTGYLAGNGNMLNNGQPVKLNNLFLRYPEAKFVLFHGGFPWTGEYTALGKMFPNVYLDLVWLSQISREEAVNSLDVMFDCVPYNKFFWGGDCHLIEESVGSLEYGRDVVSEVLANRVKRGLLTEKVALDITDKIFRDNAIEVFKLEKRLGRKFQ